MAETNQLIDVRVRTLGEILDDAYRLFLQDLGPLTFLSFLFGVPAAACFFWALTRPAPDFSWYLPVATAALLLATAVGAGACQELLRQRASGRRASSWSCIRAS